MIIHRARPKHRPSRLNTFALVRPYVRGFRRRLFLLSGLSALGGFAEAITLVAVVGAMLAVSEGESRVSLAFGPLSAIELTVTGALAIAAAAAAAAFLLRVVAALVASRMTSKSVTASRGRAFGAYVQSSWQSRSTGRAGDLQHLITTHADRVGGAVGQLVNAVSSLFTLLALVVSALVIAPLLAMATIAVMALLFAVLRPFRQLVRSRAGDASRQNRDIAHEIAETSSVSKEAYVFGVGSALSTRFVRSQVRFERLSRTVQALRRVVPELYRFVFFLLVSVALGLATEADSLDLAVLGGVLLLVVRSVTYLQSLQAVALSINEAEPYLQELNDEINRLERSQPTGTSSSGPLTTIVLENVSFSYHDTAAPSVVDLSFTLNEGESVGIVGPSGSGKSTLSALLLGLRAPTEGSILFNGVPAQDLSRRWWSRHVAFVDQESRLVSGTIADAIRFERERVTDQDVERSADLAHIGEFIRSLPQGFDTELGSLGAGLSGGQRQRIAIARALAGRPSFCVLDEPTSALDLGAEGEVVDALESILQETTLCIVSHRPSILRICDRLIVLVGGRIVYDGSPVGALDNDFYRSMLTR